MSKESFENLDLNPMSLLSMLLSFISLCVVSTLLFLPREDPLYTLLLGVDTLICLVFLIQLLTHLVKSHNKRKYLKTHWIDFIASIPIIDSLRFARVFQIFRVIRLIRSGNQVFNYVRHHRHEATFATILLLLAVLVSIGSATIYAAESANPDSNINSIGDAIWWVFVTVSTVGYGDIYPVTITGKAIAMTVIACGVGMFGMVSGLITSIIANPGDELDVLQNQQLAALAKQQERILEKLADIERTLEANKKK